MFFLRNDSKEKNSDEQDPFFSWGGVGVIFFFSTQSLENKKSLKQSMICRLSS